MWSRSKGAHPNKLTGTNTYKGAPHSDCYRSAHCKLHQLPNTQWKTVSQTSHAIKTITSCHTIPGFLDIFTQCPTCPLVHAYNSRSHAGHQGRNMGVTRIPTATAPYQVQFFLWIIILKWTRKTTPMNWNRGKRYQEEEVTRNIKIPGYHIRGCTRRQTKGSNLYKGSVQVPPPERKTQ